MLFAFLVFGGKIPKIPLEKEWLWTPAAVPEMQGRCGQKQGCHQHLSPSMQGAPLSSHIPQGCVAKGQGQSMTQVCSSPEQGCFIIPHGLNRVKSIQAAITKPQLWLQVSSTCHTWVPVTASPIIISGVRGSSGRCYVTPGNPLAQNPSFSQSNAL